MVGFSGGHRGGDALRALPVFAPMLATAAPLPADDPGWAFEFKWDGARAIVTIVGSAARIRSRRGADLTSTFPEVTAALTEQLGGRRVVLDGELVVHDEGIPDFEALARRLHTPRPRPQLLEARPVTLYAFDLLHLDGADLTAAPYLERREALAALRLAGPTVCAPGHHTGAGAGEAVMAAAARHGLEGVVAKRTTSRYLPGRRSRDWVKKPIRLNTDVVIGGFTGYGRQTGLVGSLLVGTFNSRGDLVYGGLVGTGYTQAARRHLHDLLTPLVWRTSPFTAPVLDERARYARWVRPTVTGVVAIRQWTRAGLMRHPSWQGLSRMP